jgi:hypothetical protein
LSFFFVLLYIGKENKKQRLRVSIALFFSGVLFGLGFGLLAIGFDYPGVLVGSSILGLFVGIIAVVMPNLYWWSQDRYFKSNPRLSQKLLIRLFNKRK